MLITNRLLGSFWKPPTLALSYPNSRIRSSDKLQYHFRSYDVRLKHIRSALSSSSNYAQQDAYRGHLPKGSRIIHKTTNRVWGEKSVGITEFLSEAEAGFSGIIKHRYSDFLVNEIDQRGQVVHLSDFSVPEVSPSRDPKKKTTLQDSISNLSILLNDAEVIQNIQKLFETKGQNPTSVFIEGIGSKEERAKIHRFFKSAFERKLITDTIGGRIKVEYAPENKGKKLRRSMNSWNIAEGDFCQFVLYKENRDTINAVNAIARMMKLSPKVFSYAGTKDKRGVTTQLVTGRHVKAERLNGLNKSLRGIKLGNFKYCRNKIDLGDLKGNRFVITVRDLSTDSIDIIGNAMSVVRDIGFINYYGMQRFGDKDAPTHMIGKALLLGDWEQAIDFILMPRDGEVGNIAEARQEWAMSRDPQKVVKLYPKGYVAETHVLSILAQDQRHRDFLGAISAIPRNLRMMYVHAYQSFIWNHMVSQRIRRYGFDKPVVGDLVEESEPDSCKISNIDRRHTNETYHGACVKVLTPADVSQYSIYDVVLPLPGFDVIYPENEIGNQYHELMSKDSLNPEDMQRNVREFSLPGSYRKCIAKPWDITWEISKYNDPDMPLTLTDLEMLQPSTSQIYNKTVSGGDKCALRFSFSLRSGQYATMVLREILKTGLVSHF